jgi:hypothetical protein
MRTNSASGNLFFDLSDHLPNFILLESSPPTQTTKQRPLIRIFSEQNIQKFQNTLTEANWTSVLEETNVTASYNEFIERLTNIFNQSFPLVKQSRQSAKNKTWITPAIKVSIRQKNRLYKKHLSSNSAANESAYKKYKNKLTEVIKRASLILH